MENCSGVLHAQSAPPLSVPGILRRVSSAGALKTGMYFAYPYSMAASLDKYIDNIQ
jgi:hypothetical protein